MATGFSGSSTDNSTSGNFPALASASGTHMHLTTNVNNMVNKNNNKQNKYYHNFYYKLNEDNCKLNPMELSNIYETIIHITPAQCYKVETTTLLINLVINQETIHTVNSVNNLRKKGFNLKLSSKQMDMNSIFCSNIPIAAANMDKNNLINNITNDNKDIIILDTYIPPTNNANTTAIKITLLTQSMVSHILANGIKILNNFIDQSRITRAKMLNTLQCTKCNKFNHGQNSCKNIEFVCPHCAQNHSLKSCTNKNKTPTCCNCSKDHRATSNRCTIKKKYIGIPKGKEDLNFNIIRNPESNFKYYQAPEPSSNPWTNNAKKSYTPGMNWGDEYVDNFMDPISDEELPDLTGENINNTSNNNNSNNNNSSNFTILRHKKKIQPRIYPIAKAITPEDDSDNEANMQHQARKQTKEPVIVNIENKMPKPNISYHEILLMSKEFSNWTLAFTELQKMFGLEVVTMPSTLKDQLIRIKEKNNVTLTALDSESSDCEDNNSTVIENEINEKSDETDNNDTECTTEEEVETDKEIDVENDQSPKNSGAIPKNYNKRTKKNGSHALKINSESINLSSYPKNKSSPAITRSQEQYKKKKHNK